MLIIRHLVFYCLFLREGTPKKGRAACGEEVGRGVERGFR